MNDNIPQVILLTASLKVPTLKCHRCKRREKAGYQPFLCVKHRNEDDPEDGWGYISRNEARMLNILRIRGWTDDAFEEVRAINTETPPSTHSSTPPSTPSTQPSTPSAPPSTFQPWTSSTPSSSPSSSPSSNSGLSELAGHLSIDAPLTIDEL